MLKLKKIRESKGFTQEYVAENTGMSKRSYINYETNATDIPFRKLQDIASFYGIGIIELIDDSENANFVTDADIDNKATKQNDLKKIPANLIEDFIFSRVADRLNSVFKDFKNVESIIKKIIDSEGLVKDVHKVSELNSRLEKLESFMEKISIDMKNKVENLQVPSEEGKKQHINSKKE